jgi:hypothetical protein
LPNKIFGKKIEHKDMHKFIQDNKNKNFVEKKTRNNLLVTENSTQQIPSSFNHMNHYKTLKNNEIIKISHGDKLNQNRKFFSPSPAFKNNMLFAT